MNYNLTEMTYPSGDGVHTIYAEIYAPKCRTARGIVQLAHGMIDYTGRYTELADYLTGEGYILAGNHHLGHGRSVLSDEDFGFFAERGGIDLVVKDMHTLNRYLRDTFPTLPLVVMGHSMGSFITREYIIAHPHSARAVILHGTAGPNPMVSLGITLTRVLSAIHGSHHRSRFIENMAFGGYNKRFPKEDGENAWLTREVSLVEGRGEDRFTSFKFTLSGYRDLFTMIKEVNSREWFSAYPKDMPTLIVSGDMDPVGDYGKGPNTVYKRLMVEGCNSLTLKLYEGARHELFNETNRTEVFADLVEWISGAIG